jgi:hypothetical protein
VTDDKDSVFAQGDPPSGVKKQVSSVRDTAMQADQPQQLPVQAAREVHHVFVPTVAIPDPLRQGVPRFNGKNISRFIRDYEGMCRRYYVGEDRRLTCLPNYCEDIYTEAIQVMPEFSQGEWKGLVNRLRAEYRADDYYRRMETRDFVEAFVRISTEQPSDLRHYVHDFTTISAKAVAAGNLTEQEKGWWFMRGLPINYRRHTIEKTGAVADKPSTLIFERLKEAVESRIVAIEGAKRMDVLPEEDVLNVQLIQELRQQRDKVDRRREGRLLDPGVHGGATQQQSPTTDQEVDEMVGQLRSQKLTKTELAAAARSMPFFNQIRMDPKKLTTLSNQATAQGPAQGPAQGYGPVPGYKDWQNSTRYPQDSRPPQDSQYPQGSQPPQGSRYPQDSTTFRRPQ